MKKKLFFLYYLIIVSLFFIFCFFLNNFFFIFAESGTDMFLEQLETPSLYKHETIIQTGIISPILVLENFCWR